MRLDCDGLIHLMGPFSVVHSCDVIGDGTLRVATPFTYPDGSLIDVFIRADVDPPESANTLFRGFLLSDFGQTMTYLADLGIRPLHNRTPKRLVSDVCRVLKVEFRTGELQAWVLDGEGDNLARSIVRLAQACVRVADLSFLQRHSAPILFKEEVRSYLGQHYAVEQNPSGLIGRWGREVPVDFRVGAGNQAALVKTISNAGKGKVHPLLTDAFAKWYDLEPGFKKDQFVTLIDDNENISRDDDLKRLEEKSHVLRFPAQVEKLDEILSQAG